MEILAGRGAVAQGVGVDGLFVERLCRSSEGCVQIFCLRGGNCVTGLPKGLQCTEGNVWPNTNNVDVVRGSVDSIDSCLLGEVVRCIVTISEDGQ